MVTENLKHQGSKVLKSFGSLVLASSLCFGLSVPQAIADGKDIPVYWGVGCFWHVMHEFVAAEKEVLGRTDADLSSLAGYAGGTKTAKVPS